VAVPLQKRRLTAAQTGAQKAGAIASGPSRRRDRHDETSDEAHPWDGCALYEISQRDVTPGTRRESGGGAWQTASRKTGTQPAITLEATQPRLGHRRYRIRSGWSGTEAVGPCGERPRLPLPTGAVDGSGQ